MERLDRLKERSERIQKEAIGFANWLLECGYESKYPTWYGPLSEKDYTTEELYKLYLESL